MTARLLCILFGSALAASAAHAEVSAPAAGSLHVPPPECEAHVSYDRETELPGYLIPSKGGTVCVPFTATAAKPPADYAGKDFYVEEFTDAKLRERWAQCKADEACYERAHKPIANRIPPNKEYGESDPRDVFLLGKIKEEGVVDLKSIRRPAFFAKAPYNEPIAQAEANTYTVEFTAPAEPYERLHKGMTSDVKLRGWYVRGQGVDDGKGGRVRALVVMTGGGGARLVAIDDPSDRLYAVDPKTGKTAINSFPNATTGSPGQRFWRGHMAVLHQAGFDILAYDRRGVGVSSGFSDTNTLQQGRDILDALASLSSGKGMRVLTPAGENLQGSAAAAALRGEAPAEMPVLLLGNSRGTMASGWAMAMNFDKACDYDLEVIACRPAVGNKAIKGAILFSEFSSGVGYVPTKMTHEDEGRGLGRDRGLFIAGSAVEHNIVFFPSSAILASMDKWPAAFFGRGLWDYAASLEGTMNSYDRVGGLKEIVVVRGPHPFETWPAEEQARARSRMIAFAKATALGQQTLTGGRPWSNMKELVATTSDVWEASSGPAAATKVATAP